MGKFEKLHLHRQQSHEALNRGSSRFHCQGCSMVFGRIFNQFSFKCLFVLILSLSALLCGIFWVLPRHTINSGFDAKEAIKLSATVQAYFRLEKPVSELIPYIERLEYDIYSEIGVPNTKVAVLSMHQSGASNWTDVVFGVLSNPMNVPINPVSLILLRSSFIELFLQQSNLTLTISIFGNVSMFEILKFSGGLTVIPVQSASIWQIPQVLFNFTLYNSTSEMLQKFDDLKHELELGLYLLPYESVYVQITSLEGSTVAPPVVVQVSVMSDSGVLLPQRLKQLAQTIMVSPAKNLGLDNSVFGSVKEVRLSSYLEGTLQAPSPSPSPAPSPQLIDDDVPSNAPYHAPYYRPASSPAVNQPPCFDGEVSSPTPCIMTEHPPRSSPSAAAPIAHSGSLTRQVSPALSPRSKPSPGKEGAEKLVSPSLAPSPLSSADGGVHRGILLLGFAMLLVYSLSCFSL